MAEIRGGLKNIPPPFCFKYPEGTIVAIMSEASSSLHNDSFGMPGYFFCYELTGGAKALPPTIIVVNNRRTRKLLSSISPSFRPTAINPAVKALQVRPLNAVPPIKQLVPSSSPGVTGMTSPGCFRTV